MGWEPRVGGLGGFEQESLGKKGFVGEAFQGGDINAYTGR